MFDFAEEPIRPEIAPAFRRVWDELARPGRWWSGDDHLTLARVTRQAVEGAATEPDHLPGTADQLARRIAIDAHLITEEYVQEMADTLGAFAYLELIGVVSRVTAIDTFGRLLGREPEVLPDPSPGEPSRQTPLGYVGHHFGWVPGVTPTAINGLTRMNDLAHVLYLTSEQMKDPTFERQHLERPQIELVAATVSRTNECFY